MRGPAVLHRRANSKPPPSNEAVATTFSLPTPYGGWNARGNLASMPATDAIVLDNFFPGIQSLSPRSGAVNWVTGFAANIRSLLPYESATVSKLFASTNAGIYDVTSSGTVGAAVVSCTNAQWESTNFATSGGRFLVLANGVDSVKNYDGTTWTIPAITGVTSSNLIYVTAHKKRLWFIEKDSMSLWYLPTESIAGAATLFPVGSLFPDGGKLVAIGSWTIDSGTGPDDLFVILTSRGEVAVYQGTDPASSTTWALVGVYRIGKPIGRKPLTKFGGDLLIITENGLLPLSKLLISTTADRSATISFKIDNAFLDSARDFINNFGWQAILYPTANFLLVNVPVSNDTASYQYVMNTITKAWCRFTGWNASCWAVSGTNIFFAGGLKVSKAWFGTNDYGAAITCKVAQAYTPLGFKGQKNISLVRPHISLAGAVTLEMAFDADYRIFDGQTQVTYNTASSVAAWDSALWNTGVWAGGAIPFPSGWLTVPNEPGYLHSFRMQLTTSTATFSWTATDFAARPAGIL